MRVKILATVIAGASAYGVLQADVLSSEDVLTTGAPEVLRAADFQPAEIAERAVDQINNLGSNILEVDNKLKELQHDEHEKEALTEKVLDDVTSLKEAMDKRHAHEEEIKDLAKRQEIIAAKAVHNVTAGAVGLTSLCALAISWAAFA